MIRRRFVSELGYDVEVEIDDSWETPQVKVTTSGGGAESRLMNLTQTDFEKITRIVSKEIGKC